jgi:hypothetical protein
MGFLSMEITVETISNQIPYYLTQEAKQSLAKSLHNFPKINYYTSAFPGNFLQGDGWTSFEVINFYDGDRKSVKGIILSNSCDIDIENKRDMPPKIVFAPIIKLKSYQQVLEKGGLNSEIIENKISSIIAQDITSIFYLPKGCFLDDDYIVILDDIHNIPASFFHGKEDRKKLFTLSQIGFYVFLIKLSIHFCRFHENLHR